MARIKNFPRGETSRRITVGNNRQAEVTNGTTRCYLHGHNVATFRADGRVELDTCGYMTSTTRQAMNDFLHAMGLHAGVSFAGGNVTVTGPDAAQVTVI